MLNKLVSMKVQLFWKNQCAGSELPDSIRQSMEGIFAFFETKIPTDIERGFKQGNAFTESVLIHNTQKLNAFELQAIQQLRLNIYSQYLKSFPPSSEAGPFHNYPSWMSDAQKSCFDAAERAIQELRRLDLSSPVELNFEAPENPADTALSQTKLRWLGARETLNKDPNQSVYREEAQKKRNDCQSLLQMDGLSAEVKPILENIRQQMNSFLASLPKEGEGTSTPVVSKTPPPKSAACTLL
jgi:hypothetical protein